MVASTRGHYEICKLLLEHGAAMNLPLKVTFFLAEPIRLAAHVLFMQWNEWNECRVTATLLS